MSTELDAFRDHAAEMSKAAHRPECYLRPHPWLKALPTCDTPGCMTDADRALWARLADEVDRYLGPDDEPLWEDA